MCEICHKTPCDSRCPNAPEPRSVFICSTCGEMIYEGDNYYDVLGEQICDECMWSAKREAVYDPD